VDEEGGTSACTAAAKSFSNWEEDLCVGRRARAARTVVVTLRRDGIVFLVWVSVFKE
jgi:hypothetical protein